MLYLSRKLGESIIINNNIEMKVVEIKGRSVKIGFTFPPEASVLRKEIFDSIQAANITAAQSDGDFGLDDLMGALGGSSGFSAAEPANNAAEKADATAQSANDPAKPPKLTLPPPKNGE